MVPLMVYERNFKKSIRIAHYLCRTVSRFYWRDDGQIIIVEGSDNFNVNIDDKNYFFGATYFSTLKLGICR
jgi:hypothetical protein